LPQLPLGAQEIKDKWHALTPSGSTFFAAYLTKLVIETNHVESTFLLAERVRRLTGSCPLSPIPAAIAQSTQDLVRRGISEGMVSWLPESAPQDTAMIKNILNDLLVSVSLPSTKLLGN
jgi:hypothetical protein